jgi:predicted negative regulator of RcsB-dependent stress response
LARVSLEAGDADAALSLVSESYPQAFNAQALEIKGDILRDQGDLEGAKAAYTQAIEQMDDQAFKELVQMKLDDMVPAS